MKTIFSSLCVFLAAAVYAVEPVKVSGVENCYKISDSLYRSAQPEKEGFTALQQMGIRSVLNLREYHIDTRVARHTSLCLMAYPVAAGEVTAADVENCLILIARAPKPLLVHCWHGSDRTGIVVAAYRIVFQNWSIEEAEKEFRDARFGYHEFWYENLLTLLRETDWAAMRNRITAHSASAASPSASEI